MVWALSFLPWNKEAVWITVNSAHIYLHWWVFVIWCCPSGQFNSSYPKTPDVSFEVIATDLQIENRAEWTKRSSCPFISKLVALQRNWREGKKRDKASEAYTCSMTSGAIQHGVPTNVFRTLFLVMSPPVARKALTPKSGILSAWNTTNRRWWKTASNATNHSKCRQSRNTLPAICTEPSSPRRIFPAFRSLCMKQRRIKPQTTIRSPQRVAVPRHRCGSAPEMNNTPNILLFHRNTIKPHLWSGSF